jgi:hypothetical protein
MTRTFAALILLIAAGCSAPLLESTTVVEESHETIPPAVEATPPLEPEITVIDVPGGSPSAAETVPTADETAAPWPSPPEAPSRRRVAIAIATLQPWWVNTRDREEFERRRDKAHSLAGSIRRAALARDFDPILGVAIARRESSLLPWFGEGRLRKGKRAAGPLGERGYFQIFKRGVAERRCGDCDQYDPECSARTAFCWLDSMREICGSSDLWVLVGAYGRTRCPRDAQEATGWREVARARRFYCEALRDPAECDRRWPWPRIVEARR